MPPLTVTRDCYGCRNSRRGCRRGITQGGPAFTAEAFVRLDRGAAFWAEGNKGCPAIRTEFAPFPIIAATLRTAHIPPISELHAQLIQQRLGLFEVGGIEAFAEPAINLAKRRPRLSAFALFNEQAGQARCRA
jgi:hypothetical protein